MQKFKVGNISKLCLTILSLTLLSQTVFGYDDNKVSYLDSVSSSYTYEGQRNEASLLNMYSVDARGMETTLKLDSSPIITNSQAKVNLSLRESDLKQVLRMIADKAKLNIVFDKSVEGTITLDLNNVTLNEAFMIIFKSTQLTYTIDNNTLTVLSLEAAKDLAYSRQNMTVIPIKYVNADSVAKFLNSNLFESKIFGLSNQPIVTSNPRTNQIVVFGNDADVNAIKRILPVIDTKPMVNNFKVNHTTPSEMAQLICSSLFYSEEASSSSSTTTTSSSSEEDDEVVLASGKIACRDNNGAKAGATTEGSGGLAAFQSNPLTIAYFSELGKITTYGGSVEQIEIIKEFIKEHDKKQLMAYIELSVIELNETGLKEFSNTWNLWTPFISLGFHPEAGLNVSPFYVWESKHDSAETSVRTSNSKALIYQLKYLIDNGNGRVLTNPRIMVTNGKKSVIDMTSDYIKSVTSQVLQNSNGITGATQRTYDIGSDEGLMIEIIPFISPDGYVSMNITPELATIKSQVPGENGTIAATLLQRRDLELKNIRIKDGETLVLAGLIKENEAQTTKKMPILSDLPFVGAFFRGSTSSKSREELVIVVTPHIVKDTEDTDSNIYDL